MRRALFALAIGAGSILLLGCQQGEMEKAGERADEIVDNAKDGDPLLHKKGPIEKAGDQIEETVDKATD